MKTFMIVLPAMLLGAKRFTSMEEVEDEAQGETVAFRVGYVHGALTALVHILAIEGKIDEDVSDDEKRRVAYQAANWLGWFIFGLEQKPSDETWERFAKLLRSVAGTAANNGLKLGFADMKNFHRPDHFSFSWRLAVPELREKGYLNDWGGADEL